MHLPKTDKHFAGFESYQKKQCDTAISLTRRRGLAIDVGAHVGFWSKEFNKHFHKVVSIEPVKENFDCLVKNVPDAVHINAACSDKLGFVSMHNPAPENSGAWEATEGGDIECITIDSLNLIPDLIKMDVQGYERQVIDGAMETIKCAWPTLCVEVVYNGKSNDELVKYIKSIGYTNTVQVKKDMIFTRPEYD
jgi:FkbM family methyltransferase